MLEKITNNWAWKILSLAIAFAVWLGVVNIDDPYTRNVFENIRVEKRNSEVITSQEQAITYLEGETIDVLLGGNRSRIENLDPADITAYVDMNKVSITGAIDIEVEVPDQLDILDKTPNNMQITLEQIDTVLKDVQVFYDGALAEDYVKLNPVVTPNQVELRGPESKLAMVASVIVNVKIDEATDDITVFASPKLQDSDGNDVTDLTVNNNQIEIKVPIQKIKTVPVRFATIGEVSSEYRLMSMGLELEDVLVRGETEVIDNLNGILVSDVDLTALTDEVSSFSVNLSTYLPEGIQLYGSETITQMNVDVRSIVTSEYAITAEDIRVKSLDEHMQFKFLEELTIPVVVSGIQADLNGLEIDDMRPSISLKDLEPGEHEVEIELNIFSEFEVINEIPKVLVELTEVLEDEEVSEGETTEEVTTGD